jgi:hypothetical protein
VKFIRKIEKIDYYKFSMCLREYKMLHHLNLYTIKIIFLLTLISSQCYAQSAEEWKLQKTRDSIFIYTKLPEGSKFKSIKSITEYKCSLSTLLNLIKDVNSHSTWIYKCTESKMLKINSDSSFIFYEHFEVPWPANDRDIIIKNKINYDPIRKTVLITEEGIPDYLPEKNDMVRIQSYHGTWKLRDERNGLIFSEYIVTIDPGGYIPAWIINLFATTGPYESTMKLKKIFKGG